MLLFGIGYHYYEKKMAMYDEQKFEYENQIVMCKKQIDIKKLEYERGIAEQEQRMAIMDEQKLENERRIAEQEQRTAIVNEQKVKHERRIAEQEQQMAIMDEQKLENERRIAEQEQRTAIVNEQKVKHERRIAEQEQRMAIMDEQKLENERRIAEQEQRTAIVNEQKVKHERRIAEQEQRMAIMDEQKLENERRIAEQEQRIAIMNEQKVKHEKRIAEQEQQMAINYQVNLIIKFKLGMYKAQASTDHYVTKLKRYCELNDNLHILLSSQEKDELSQLEDDLELYQNKRLDIKEATSIIRQISKETIKFLSSRVEVLEDTLHEMDIEKMKRLQEYMNKEYLDAFFKRQMERMKMKLQDLLKEVQQRGIMDQIFSVVYDNFIPVVTHIVKLVATNVIKGIFVL